MKNSFESPQHSLNEFMAALLGYGTLCDVRKWNSSGPTCPSRRVRKKDECSEIRSILFLILTLRLPWDLFDRCGV